MFDSAEGDVQSFVHEVVEVARALGEGQDNPLKSPALSFENGDGESRFNWKELPYVNFGGSVSVAMTRDSDFGGGLLFVALWFNRKNHPPGNQRNLGVFPQPALGGFDTPA